jgi:hypothetical protein
VGAEGTRIEVRRIPSAADGVIFHVDVTREGHTTSIEVPHSEALSESELARDVQSRLKTAGVDARVSIERGAMRVDMHR